MTFLGPHHTDKTANLILPPGRDYFRLPSIPLPRTPPNPHSNTQSPISAFMSKLPSLDYSQAQAGQYWPGANASSPAIGGQPQHTLPTPPTAETDVFKPPPGQPRKGSYNVATAIHHSGMSSQLDHGHTPSSLTARRSAASNLPNFELPPPQPLSKGFPPFPAINASQPLSTNGNVGNLLTPPSNIPGESLSPISSGVNSGTSASQNGLPPYTPNGYWQPSGGTGTTPFSFGTGTTPQPWGQGALNPLFPPRGMFSPSLGSLMRTSSSSPSAGESVPPPYDINQQLPPFPGSMSMSAPASLPAIAAQQQAYAYMNSQTPVSSTTQPSPINAPEPYMQRPPPTPGYYSSGSQPSSTPQQSQFPAFTAPSPAQQSPLGANGANGSRISPINGQPPNLQPAHNQQSHQYSRPFQSYSLPAMSGGPIMSNIHSPGSQMALMGHHGSFSGFNSGHSAAAAQMHHQQMYGGHMGQQPGPGSGGAHNDRPFKCDQCPQSFNRNHDLKRHKRIHLAVKPFPCGHCEKSFSRKDALKVCHFPGPSGAHVTLTPNPRDISSSRAAVKPATRTIPTRIPKKKTMTP